MEKSVFENLEGSIFLGGIQENEKMWLFPCKKNYILCYFMNNKKYQIYHLPSLDQYCLDVSISGEYMYLLGEFGKIYRWKIDNLDVEVVKDLHLPSQKYMLIFVVGRYIYLFPLKNEDIFRIDGSELEKQEFPKDFGYVNTRSSRRHCTKDENRIYFPMEFENYAAFLDKKTGKLEWYVPKIPVDFVMEEKGFVYESVQMDIQDYLQYLLEEKDA